MKDINILSLDLEFNQPSESIIQIGAVVGNLSTGDILEELQIEINAKETLAPFIIKLTGISQDEVDNGETLLEGYNKLKDMFIRHDCFRNCLTWGGGDSQLLRSQLDLDDEMFLFGRRWIDAKTLFVSHCFANDIKHQSGLAKSLTRVGLAFKGSKHNAKDDALNTFIIYRRLLGALHNNYQDVRTGYIK
ncbi:MAG: hypothetical protein COB41_00250 [Proteobacteria bacterium]|nr:MAG: hypothetical protein COB41_00250 [Pseudomonadota bacterium]